MLREIESRVLGNMLSVGIPRVRAVRSGAEIVPSLPVEPKDSQDIILCRNLGRNLDISYKPTVEISVELKKG